MPEGLAVFAHIVRTYDMCKDIALVPWHTNTTLMWQQGHAQPYLA